MWLDAKFDKKELTLPKLKDIIFTYESVFEYDEKSNTDASLAPQPFAASAVFEANATTVLQSKRIDGKEFLYISLQSPAIESLSYEPGDTIGIWTENSDETVATVIQHIIPLDSEWIRITSCDTKLNYLPECVTWTNLLKYYINLRSIPQKMFLLVLANGFDQNSEERRILEVLASKEGADQYRTLILEAGVTAFDIITALRHNKPHITALVKYLPRLLPRPYSIASSPLRSADSIHIALSVLPGERAGICTGLLRKKLSKGEGTTKVKMYLRKSQGFRLPEDPLLPLILVGPGTGIAPYIGFLQHRKFNKTRGRIHLFTGFPTKKDELFTEEVQEHLAAGVLSDLFVSYSREPDQGSKYVQDLIKKHWRLVGEVVDSGGLIYECGDQKIMKQSITDAFAEALQLYYDIDQSQARDRIKSLKKEKRYLHDVWC